MSWGGSLICLFLIVIYMVNGIAFITGHEPSLKHPLFKVESGSYIFINDIIDEEFARGYEPVCIACDGSLGFILFKKVGV